jgi:Zn-dependent protease with chaperone function
MALLIVARAAGRWVSHRRAMGALPAGGGAPLVVLDVPEPVAYAHPGDGGSIVVSHGLMASLSQAERLVVLAHERAHLDRHHSRYLLAGELASAGLPLVAPLTRALRWCTERAADEDTAMVVGDRELVAATIAKSAMAAVSPSLAGISGSTVVDRVEALLSPPPARSPVGSILLACVAAIAMFGAGYQAHHFAEVILHLG